MSRIVLGLICGLVFGAIDHRNYAADELPREDCNPRSFHCTVWDWIRDRRGPFALAWLGGRPMLRSALSIPDALITKAYAPIIGMGAVGGTIIGVLIGRFGH